MTGMTAIRNPRVTLNMVQRDQIVGLEEQRVLIVGQKTSAGLATADALSLDVPITDAEIDELFGARSHLAGMCRAFRKRNKVTKLDAFVLGDKEGSTAATATIAIAGTATAARTVYFDIVSSRSHSYKVDISVGDTGAEIAAVLQALIAADTRAPFTATVSTTTVTLTAANKGTGPNGLSWLLRVRDSAKKAPVTPGITVTLTSWASGASDPLVSGVDAAIDNIRYQTIVWPAHYDRADMLATINARFNLDNDIKDGVVFQFAQNSVPTLASTALSVNSPSWVLMGNEARAVAHWKGPHIPEHPDHIAAIMAAVRARRFEDGISISDLVVINEQRDQFGGRHIASLPYFNTPLIDVEMPEIGTGFSDPEQRTLRQSGYAVLGANIRNNAVIASVMVTTYINDAAGNPDDTWSYLEWRDTHSVIREFFVNNLREDFAQHRMTDGIAVPNMAMIDEASVRAKLLGYYLILSGDGLTVSGRDHRQYFEDNLVVTIKSSLRRVELYADVPMVSQFGEALGSIKFHFDA